LRWYPLVVSVALGAPPKVPIQIRRLRVGVLVSTPGTKPATRIGGTKPATRIGGTKPATHAGGTKPATRIKHRASGKAFPFPASPVSCVFGEKGKMVPARG